ncbi:hypothetical protein LTR28_007710 [Elasticomyces elasticus]|nr:hypothetical protein LTR28_007710 [Elasticomyces elasticus]
MGWCRRRAHGRIWGLGGGGGMKVRPGCFSEVVVAAAAVMVNDHTGRVQHGPSGAVPTQRTTSRSHAIAKTKSNAILEPQLTKSSAPELGLIPTFSTWSQISFLHMYLLTVRLRTFPAAHAKHWHQNLVDHFFYAAEDRMATLHRMAARGVRNKYLKDFSVVWRGVIAAYDEGIVKGDAVLAAAVWRNVFKADREVDVRKIAVVVAYMRRMLSMLDGLDDAVVAGGEVVFADPGAGWKDVGAPSAMMKKPFAQEETTAAVAGA